MSVIQSSKLDFKSRVLSRHPDTAFQEVDGQAMVVIPFVGEVQVLSEVGTLIWGLLDGRRTLGEILDKIQEEYGVDPAQAEADLQKFVADLEARQMLAVPQEQG